jgi:hypothetical protein
VSPKQAGKCRGLISPARDWNVRQTNPVADLIEFDPVEPSQPSVSQACLGSGRASHGLDWGIDKKKSGSNIGDNVLQGKGEDLIVWEFSGNVGAQRGADQGRLKSPARNVPLKGSNSAKLESGLMKNMGAHSPRAPKRPAPAHSGRP